MRTDSTFEITGINLITYYATLLFERLGLGDVDSRIVAACNGTEYFLISIVAIFIIDRIGRRKLMLFGMSPIPFPFESSLTRLKAPPANASP